MNYSKEKKNGQSQDFFWNKSHVVRRHTASFETEIWLLRKYEIIEKVFHCLMRAWGRFPLFLLRRRRRCWRGRFEIEMMVKKCRKKSFVDGGRCLFIVDRWKGSKAVPVDRSIRLIERLNLHVVEVAAMSVVDVKPSSDWELFIVVMDSPSVVIRLASVVRCVSGLFVVVIVLVCTVVLVVELVNGSLVIVFDDG